MKETSTRFSCSVPAFLFYCWLCVVSHFQVLREVAQLGLDNIENVQPFKGSSIHDVCKYLFIF